MVDDLVTKIADESGKDEDDIKERIEDKMQELSGLVSEEGAAHLIAREEGVELAEAEAKELKIENIVPGMNRVDIKGKVTNITDVNTFETDDGEGKVQNIVLGDETGTVRMSLWNDQLEVAEKIDEGDSLHIQGAYSREDNRGNPELRIGDSTQIQMLDEDLGDVKEQSSSGGGGSHDDVKVSEVANENVNYEVTGTIVEVYADDPFYNACPECNKKVEEDEETGEWTCEEHGEVERQFNLILSVIVDDGYDNIRTVFFRDRAKEALGAEDEEFNGNTELVKEYAAKVKGKDVTVQGRSRYNDFFDRMELIGNNVAFNDEQTMIEEKLAEVKANE